MLERAGLGDLEDLGRPGAVVGTQDVGQLSRRPGIELPLHTFAVGVERGREATLGRTQLAQHEVGGAGGDPLAERAAPAGVEADQLGVVVEHLLEVRHHPLRVDGVAREAAAELVVDPAACHRLAGRVEHLPRRGRAVPQQELEHHRRRELRRAAEPPVARVELTGQRLDRGVDLLPADRTAGQGGHLVEVLAHRAGHAAYVVTAVVPGVHQRLEHLPERRRAVPRLVREVGAREERGAVVVEHDRSSASRRGRSSRWSRSCRPHRRRAAPRGRP